MKKIFCSLILIMLTAHIFGQNVAYLSNMGQLTTYAGSATAVTVKDTIRGGIFYKIAKGSSSANNITTFKSITSDSIWYRQYNQAQGINIEWAGAIRINTNADNSGAINLAAKIADLLGENVFFPGFTYYCKDQLVITNSPWVGVKSKTKIVFAHDAILSDSSHSHFSMLYNSNFNTLYDETTANTVNISGINFNFRVNQYHNSLLYGIEIANVSKGNITDCMLTDSAGLTNLNKMFGNSIFDIYSGVKNFTIKDVQIHHLNQSFAGGGLWIRNAPALSGGYKESYNTENIIVDNVSIWHAGGDEAFTAYGSTGKTKNILITNCQFYSLPTTVNRAKLVSVFAFNQKSRPYSIVSNVHFDNCYFEDDSFTANIITIASSIVDTTRIIDSNILISNCKIISRQKVSNPGTAIMSSSLSQTFNCVSINNDVESNGVALSNGISNFNIVSDGSVSGPYTTASINNCTEVFHVKVTSNTLGIVGVVDPSIITDCNITTNGTCIQYDKSALSSVKNNTLVDTRNDGTPSFGVYAKSLGTNTPDIDLINNTISLNNAQSIAMYKEGTGTQTRAIGNTLLNTGFSWKIATSGASPFLEVAANNLFGTLEDLRISGFINANHDNAVPIGKYVRNITGNGGFVKTGTAGTSMDWITVGDIIETQTTVLGSTNGTAKFSQPFQGIGYKKVIVYCSSLIGNASYTFPVAFINTPAITTSDSLPSSVVTSKSNTTITITGTSTTGFIFIEGF